MDLGENLIQHKIEKTLVERDLGILLSSDLKWTNQTVKATKAAKSIIDKLRNSFKYFDAELVRLLCLVSKATFRICSTSLES